MSDEHGNVLSPVGHGHARGASHHDRGRVELEDLGGRTKMVMTHVGIPERLPGAAGWTMAFDKLGAHLRRMESD